MGRAKLLMRKIEDRTNRQVTFSKRKTGLLKKAFEIALLCDVDLVMYMFSPGGKLTQFCKDDRFEEVFSRYISTSTQEKKKRREENREYSRRKSCELKLELNMKSEIPDENEMKVIMEQIAQEWNDNETIHRQADRDARWNIFSTIQLQEYKQELQRHRGKIDELLEEVSHQINMRIEVPDLVQREPVPSHGHPQPIEPSQDNAQASSSSLARQDANSFLEFCEVFTEDPREMIGLPEQPLVACPTAVQFFVDESNGAYLERDQSWYNLFRRVDGLQEQPRGASQTAVQPVVDGSNGTNPTEYQYSQSSFGLRPSAVHPGLDESNLIYPTEYDGYSLDYPMDSPTMGQSSQVDHQFLETGNSMGYTRLGENDGVGYDCRVNNIARQYFRYSNNGLQSDGNVGRFNPTHHEHFMQRNDRNLVRDNGIVDYYSMNNHPRCNPMTNNHIGWIPMNPTNRPSSTQCIQMNHQNFSLNSMDAVGVGQNYPTDHIINPDHPSLAQDNQMHHSGLDNRNPGLDNHNPGLDNGDPGLDNRTEK